MYELLEDTEDKQWTYGFFNFVIDDHFVPGVGSNYTLNMVFNHLKGAVDDLRNAPIVDLSNQHDTILFTNLSKALGWLPEDEFNKALEASDAEFEEIVEKNKTLPLGVDITPLEVKDTGWGVYYFRSTEEECLIYSPDAGQTTMRKVLPLGTVAGLIEQLPNTPI